VAIWVLWSAVGLCLVAARVLWRARLAHQRARLELEAITARMERELGELTVEQSDLERLLRTFHGGHHPKPPTVH